MISSGFEPNLLYSSIAPQSTVIPRVPSFWKIFLKFNVAQQATIKNIFNKYFLKISFVIKYQ
jgi:hypothetical protein